MITLLVDPGLLSGEEVRVEGDAYRHLFRARRLALGELVRVVDGEGRARWARVSRVDRREGALTLEGAAPTHEPPRPLELLVPLPRKERASWLVEKVTELGVSAVRFVHSQRGPREIGPGALERLCRVAAAAVEQSHRARLPAITGVHPWEELPRLLEASVERWVLDTQASAEGMEGGEKAPQRQDAGGLALLVGPEGGWSEEERRHLQRLSCRALSLGERTLRVETAALVGVGLLLLDRPLLIPPVSS